jgi:hypothetical protein
VKLVGKLRVVGEPLTAPLSRVRCGYYLFHLMERPWSISREMLVLDEERRDFILEDETGRALVRVERALFFASRNCVKVSGGLSAPQLQQVREQYKLQATGHGLRGSERVLAENDDVVVCGLASSELDPEGQPSSYRDPPRRFVISVSASMPMFISDDPNTRR